MALLTYKTEYLISKKLEIYNKIYPRLHTKLKLDGEAEVSYILTIKCILELLETGIVPYNMSLELYKKLVHLLRFFGIMYKIPDPKDNSNPTLYWGVGAQNLNAGILQSTLTQSKQIFSTNISFTYNATLQVYYFCYPQSLGVLTSIKDNNGFETISGWTRKSMSFVFVGLENIPYYVYEFNNLTSVENFTNRFYLT